MLVRLPHDKARLAVVVRSDLLAELSYATLLPITTDLRDGMTLRIGIEPTGENGLRAESQAMVDWPQTVRVSEMGAVIGRLQPTIMLAITRQLAVGLEIGANARRPQRITGV